jgi:hypothetical protein
LEYYESTNPKNNIMDIRDEDDASIAKRKAIQAIMRDTSLSGPEKQRKIQEYMASGGENTALTTSSATEVETALAQQPSSAQSIPPPATTKQAMMQEVMKDPNLTPQEKQIKIQDILKNETSVLSTTTTVTEVAESATSTPVIEPPESRVGATSTTGVDPAARKSRAVARTLSAASSSSISSSQQQTATTTGSDNGISEEPSSAQNEVATADSVANTGLDPASRKATFSNMNTGTGTGTARRSQRAGASQSSAAQDPAALKGQRFSNRSSQATRNAITADTTASHPAERSSTVATVTTTTSTTSVSEQIRPSQPPIADQSLRQSNVDDSRSREIATSSPSTPVPPPPTTQRPEERENYAGLNYSGDVAMDGIAVRFHLLS